ncbi:MAG TPA: cation:proton antiporter [Methylomirabilota bacterium]|nr:cation:proton antiporter [Methylomirabilota bacterium]
MVADPSVFRDLAYVFVAAVVGGALARLARQPLILGYVAAGILVGPLTPGPAVSDVHGFELMAEVGVVLLMFSIGIELSLKDLLAIRRLALVGVPLGLAAFIGLATGLGLALGWSALRALSVGIVLCVQSTMVAARLLMDRGETGSRHGRLTIGILLVEDLAVVALIILLPTLGALDRGGLLAIAKALGTAALILVPFLVLARRVVPRLLLQAARMRSDEMFLFVALAVGLATAALTQALGLSVALGAFLAGLLISESDFAHDTLARLLPLRDTFAALFFVTLGMLLDPAQVLANLPLLGIMVGLIVVGNLAVWTAVVRLFGESVWNAVLTAVALTQIGEFSFVLVQVARRAGYVGDDVYNATLAASLLTILLNALLVQKAPGWIGALRLRGAGPPPAVAPSLEGHVILCGYGRVGSAIGEALETFGIRYVAVETDPDIVKGLQARGVPSLFGDAARRGILEAAGAARAALVVVALPEMERARLAVRALRAINPRLPLLARAHHTAARDLLIDMGATEVIQPEVEAAATLLRHSLERLAVPRPKILAYLERLRAAADTALILEPLGREDLPFARDLTLGEGPLAGRSLRDLRVRERFGVVVLTVTCPDGEFVPNPSAETVFRAGDRVRVFGLREQIERFAAAGASRG